MQAFYNLAFSNTDGGGAGICLLGTMRMFLGYHGAIMYRMQAGMGETVFAPMYQVLVQRGVTFEFFHRVHSLSEDKKSIQTIEVGRQATTTQTEPLCQPPLCRRTWPQRERSLFGFWVDFDFTMHTGREVLRII